MVNFDFQLRIDYIIKYLKVYGAWKNDDRPVIKMLYAIYSTSLVIIYNLHNMATLVNIYNNSTDLEVVFSSGLVTLTKLVTNVKLYFVMTNSKNILKLSEISSVKMFQPRNKRQLQRTNSLFKDFDTFFFLMRITPLLCILFWDLYALLEVKNERKLPFLAWYPYDYKKSPFYELTFFHQTISCIVMTQVHVHADFMLFSLLAIAISQFDILSDNLLHVTRKSKELEYSEDSSKYMEIKLINCVKHHQQILLFFKKINEMVDVLVMGQYTLSTISICLTLLQISIIEPKSTAFIALIVYQGALFGQLFTYCWWGNEVISRSSKIPNAAYASDWINAPIPYRKILLHFIQRTQKPVALYALDFFKVSLESFTAILRQSYSFYAVLRHMNSAESN